MADRRMFTKKVSDSDAFIEMSSAAQALYFHLNQGADDDGFNNQVQIAMLKAHASLDDLKVLMMKNFIIRFDSGVIVIKHWRMHNTLRKDRYTPTNFQEELSLLGIKDNGSYTLGCQSVANRLPQDSIVKDSTVEDNRSVINNTLVHSDTETHNDKTEIEEMFDVFWKQYPKKSNKKGARVSFKRIKNLKTEFPLIMEALEKFKKSKQWTKQNGEFIPLPTTWINQERWKDEHIETREEKLRSLDMSDWL